MMTPETLSFAWLNSNSHTILHYYYSLVSHLDEWTIESCLERVDAASIYRESRGGAMSLIHVPPSLYPWMHHHWNRLRWTSRIKHHAWRHVGSRWSDARGRGPYSIVRGLANPTLTGWTPLWPSLSPHVMVWFSCFVARCIILYGPMNPISSSLTLDWKHKWYLRVEGDLMRLHMDYATSPSPGPSHGRVGRPHLCGSRCSFSSKLIILTSRY